MTCQPSYCSPHEVCQVSDGVLRCVGVGSATCQVSGTSHYITFDGRRFDFMGNCVYVLAQTCWVRPGLQQFTILQENMVWDNKQVSVPKMITVQVANYTLQLEQNQWKVKVRAELGHGRRLPVGEGHMWEAQGKRVETLEKAQSKEARKQGPFPTHL